MKNKPTHKELELSIKKLKRSWKWTYWTAVLLGLVLLFLLGASGFANQKLESQLTQYQNSVPVPEAINGNLYIGYEDGVRIGYHQDYLNKSIWYRCVKTCEVIE